MRKEDYSLNSRNPLPRLRKKKTKEAEDHLNRGIDLAARLSQTGQREFVKYQRIHLTTKHTWRLAVAYRRLGFYGDCIKTLAQLLDLNPYHLRLAQPLSHIS